MEINLSKGQDIVLEKSGGGSLRNMILGVGWDPVEGGGDEYDMDASVAVSGASAPALVYYGNLKEAGIVHAGDDLTGGSSDTGPDEEITINLDEVNGTKVSCLVTLHDATSRKSPNGEPQNMSHVSNAFVEVRDADTNEALARYNITNSDMNGHAMHFADVVKDDNGEWHFKPLAESLGTKNLSEAFQAVQ